MKNRETAKGGRKKKMVVQGGMHDKGRWTRWVGKVRRIEGGEERTTRKGEKGRRGTGGERGKTRVKGKGGCKTNGSEREGRERWGEGEGGRKGNDENAGIEPLCINTYTPGLCRRPSCGVVRAEVLTCAALALLSLLSIPLPARGMQQGEGRQRWRTSQYSAHKVVFTGLITYDTT
jgi:hypothetical protein